MRRTAHKYNAVKTVVDGFSFHSKAEARRYRELVWLKLADRVIEVVLQPAYDLVVNGQKIGRYVGDFEWVEPNGEVHLEDVKGIETPVFKLKAKLFKALYGFNIEVIHR